MTAISTDLSTVRTRRPKDWTMIVAGTICLLLITVAILGPLLAPYPSDQTDVLAIGQGPSASHLFGTDSLGRDIFSRVLVGARLSFAAPLLIVLLSGLIGTAIAIFSAWNGRWVDRGVNRILNVIFAVPGILVAVIASAVFGAGFWAPVLGLSLVYVPYVARVVRSAAVRERQLPYVEGLQLAGLSSWSICAKHILRNVAPLLLAQATIGFGSALVDFAGVSFVGLGVQAPAAEWGVMVSEGRSEVLAGAIQQSLAAGMCIVVTVVAFNILGDRLVNRFGGAQ
ncbi:MAG: ABC transporter permease [Nocardioides sp.]|uniref:ABC transporter permease n=1 Tax=Nocardioides sp. TaxID=35761 RepID=UPI0039E6F28F